MHTASFRLPERHHERLEAASRERGVFRSELMRRCVEFYIAENPDAIEAFTDASARSRGGAPDEQPRGMSGVYDPTEGV